MRIVAPVTCATRRYSAFTSCAQGMPLSFDTSHNKKVEGNYTGLVKRDTKRSARQYMNRIGAPCIASPLSLALTSASILRLQVVSTGRCPRRKLTGERLAPNLRFSAFFSSIRLMKDGGFGLAAE